jgi:hypothetical protein
LKKNELRVLLSCKGFYEVLCRTLLTEKPEYGLELYRLLKGADRISINFVDSYTRIPLLEYYLSNSIRKDCIERAWEERFEECNTDHDIFELILTLKKPESLEWLRDKQRELYNSGCDFEKAKSLVILGLSSFDDAVEKLKDFNQPGIAFEWVYNVGYFAHDWCRKFNWTKHWYTKFAQTENLPEAVCFFRIFLRCVDRRFWSWQKKTEKTLSLTEQKMMFFESNIEKIKNKCRKNEEKLKKTFLNQRVLKDKCWPWLSSTKKKTTGFKPDLKNPL